MRKQVKCNEDVLNLLTNANEQMKALSKPLRSLAANWSNKKGPSTKYEQLNEIRLLNQNDRLGMCIQKTHARLAKVVEAINTYNRAKMRLRTHGHCCHSKLVVFPDTLQIRMKRKTRKVAQQCYEEAIRMSVNNEKFDVILNAAHPDVQINSRIYYRGYASSCRFNKTCYETKISLPKNWYSSVYRRGIAVVNYHFILKADFLYTTVHGVEVFSAVAAKNGRGNSVKMIEMRITRFKGAVIGSETNPGAFMTLPSRSLPAAQSDFNSGSQHCLLSAA